MTDGIKSLAKIQGNDNNIGVGCKERGDSMKDGNKGRMVEPVWTKSKLIMKGKSSVGGGARRAGTYNNLLKYHGKNWGDGNWSKVSAVLLERVLLEQVEYISLFPL